MQTFFISLFIYLYPKEDIAVTLNFVFTNRPLSAICLLYVNTLCLFDYFLHNFLKDSRPVLLQNCVSMSS